jgi:hypothetical protein
MSAENKLPPLPLVLRLSREVGSDYILIEFPDGSTEEVEGTEAVEWFRLRHAGKMDQLVIERALDETWNFLSSVVVIQNPKEVNRDYTRVDPKI